MTSNVVGSVRRGLKAALAYGRGTAGAQGVSINQFVATVTAERVGELKALNPIRLRIARAHPTEARAVLALVPDRAPLEGDQLPFDIQA